MANYKFIEKSTGKQVTLDEVDGFACEVSGEKLDAETFCAAYQGLVGWMFAAFMNTNTWDNAKALKWLTKYEANEPGSIVLRSRDGKDTPLLPIISKVLDHYKMVAWRK